MSSGNIGSSKPRIPGTERKIFGLPESTVKSVAGIALAVGAVVGVLKYTKRDKDVERDAKGFKNKVERKGNEIKDSWK